ncbi:MAG: hypothetical protein V4795_24885 [Pseudomonadota bacterium]
MIDTRHKRLDSRAWQATTPGELAPLAARAAMAPGRRPQPPLQEVLQGLDSRELEGPTVFDQLFGPLPDGDPRPRRGR